jgi:hypothetical protein
VNGSIIKVEPNKQEVLVMGYSEVAKFAEDKSALDNEIFAEKNAHSAGMYMCDFEKGRIYTIDDEQNLFEIFDDGYANCNLHDDVNKVIMEEKQDDEKEKEENKENSQINNDSKAANKEEVPNAESQPQENKEPENVDNPPQKLERPPSPDYEKLNEENIEVDKKPKKVAPTNLNQSNVSNNVTTEKKRKC